MNRADLRKIKRMLIASGAGLCVATAFSWHDWRAVLINLGGFFIVALVVRHRRRARRTAGAR